MSTVTFRQARDHLPNHIQW